MTDEQSRAAESVANEAHTAIEVSRGFASWLSANRASLAFTSYQTGQLFLVGVLPNGQVSFNQQNFQRAMGVHHQAGRLYLGSLFQVWRLENMLRPGEVGNAAFDSVLVPRNAQTTGDIDIHELSVDRDGRVVFVNTKYSCLATLSLTHSFRPIWKPTFISKLAPEDRCHLNGLAMLNGVPKYATAVSRSDIVNGWRERRSEGGVLIDIETDAIVTDRLSMPHSPRAWGDRVWALDSGRGYLITVDPASGAKEDIAFCPGFVRGLTFHNGHAIATVSKPRNGTFAGLALEDALRERDGEAWCGVLVIDVRAGGIVEWIRLQGAITELFDVAVMPDVVCPMSIGAASPEIRTSITLDEAEPTAAGR
ncbi:TIGR03032 family protein [Phenylobacterium sp.]|uniref:TIGR03032 family protein n=1 Tax=Phenylobacterium sp. TaxID=1871053 RepID=UPI003566AF47